MDPKQAAGRIIFEKLAAGLETEIAEVAAAAKGRLSKEFSDGPGARVAPGPLDTRSSAARTDQRPDWELALERSRQFAASLRASRFERQAPRTGSVRTEGMSDELFDLIQRSERGDAAVVEVKVSDGKAIEAGSDTCHIFTRGLSGCYLTAVDMTLPSGARRLALTHYPIVSESAVNVRRLAELVPDETRGKPATTIFAPDTYDLLGGTHDSFVRHVGMVTRSDVTVRTYPMLGDLSARDHGTFRFALPASSSTGPIVYRSWSARGTLENFK